MNYQLMTKEALYAEGKKRGIHIVKSMLKSEMIDTLKNYDNLKPTQETTPRRSTNTVTRER